MTLSREPAPASYEPAPTGTGSYDAAGSDRGQGFIRSAMQVSRAAPESSGFAARHWSWASAQVIVEGMAVGTGLGGSVGLSVGTLVGTDVVGSFVGSLV